VPEIIEPVFTKTSQNARFLLSENERFGLVFVKTGSINSGTGRCVDYKVQYTRTSRTPRRQVFSGSVSTHYCTVHFIFPAGI